MPVKSFVIHFVTEQFRMLFEPFPIIDCNLTALDYQLLGTKVIYYLILYFLTINKSVFAR